MAIAMYVSCEAIGDLINAILPTVYAGGGGSKSSSYQSGNPKRDVTFGSPEGI